MTATVSSVTTTTTLEDTRGWNVNHVDFVAVVLSAHVGAYVGRLLRGVVAIGAAESRQLPALELHVRVEVVLPIEDARALRARVYPRVPTRARRQDLRIAGWYLEAAQVHEICKKTFGTRQSSVLCSRDGRFVASVSVFFFSPVFFLFFFFYLLAFPSRTAEQKRHRHRKNISQGTAA